MTRVAYRPSAGHTDIGRALRKKRIEAGVSQEALAFEMGQKTSGFLCQLESGARAWSAVLIGRYEAALARMTEAKAARHE